MSAQYHPLRLNVGFLLSQTAGYSREFDFREEQLTLGHDFKVQNFTGHLVLHRTPQGIVAKGSFLAESTTNCARCLKEFNAPIQSPLEDLFVYPPPNPADPLLQVGDDGYIDLDPILRECMMIDQPIRALCREDCQGLCPVCGNDLNEGPCSHPEEPAAVPAVIKARPSAKKTNLPGENA